MRIATVEAHLSEKKREEKNEEKLKRKIAKPADG
jgi:hypothetical protein